MRQQHTRSTTAALRAKRQSRTSLSRTRAAVEELEARQLLSTTAGSISGVVWEDLNGNGARDAGEPGLEGWTVYIDSDYSGALDPGEVRTVTAADGSYTLAGLPANTYYVSQVVPAGWQQTYPAAQIGQSIASSATTDAAPAATDVVSEIPAAPPPIHVNPVSHTAPFSSPTVQPSRSIKSLASAAIALPARFDLRPGYVTSVKDQGQLGDCWTFATMASVESSILKDGGPAVDLSENNLKDYHGFDWAPGTGGNFDMSIAYFSRGSGPVSEADDPYHDWDDRKDPPPVYPPKYYIRSADFLDSDQEIKTALMSEGAVGIGMYWDDNSYNAATSTYLYPDFVEPNHNVTIVGWDDAKVVPGTSTPGAWLIKNSWGKAWGDNGYFWLSYADPNVHDGTSFHDAVAPGTFDRIYYYDDRGDTTEYDISYAFNAFTASEDSMLTSIGFYTQADGAGYEIRSYDTFDGSALSGLLSTQTGATTYAGYHTIDLSQPVRLTAGHKFYVYLHLTNAGTYPMAVDQRIAGYTSSTASPGQSYFSFDGTAWSDLTTFEPTANAAIKALTIAPPAGAQQVTLGEGEAVTGIDFGNEPTGTTLNRDVSGSTTVRLDATGTFVQFFDNVPASGAPTDQYALADLATVVLTARAANSRLIIDLVNGGPPVRGGVFFDGAGENPVLQVLGSPEADSVRIDNNGIAAGAARIIPTSIAGTEIDLLGGDDALTAGGNAALTLAPGSMASLMIEDNAGVTLAPGEDTLPLAGLAISGKGALDIADNDLILTHADTDHGTARVEQLRQWLRSALVGGGEQNPWTGTGLTSTAARDSQNMDKAIAIFNNDDGEGNPWLDNFNGIPIGVSTIILKYTYYGDSNTDGTITGDDFAAATAGWFDQMNGIAPTWMTGDYDYDQKVTADDFALVTNSWFSQDRAHPLSASPTPLDIPAGNQSRDDEGREGTASPTTSDATPFAPTLSSMDSTRKPDPNPLLVDDLAVLA